MTGAALEHAARAASMVAAAIAGAVDPVACRGCAEDNPADRDGDGHWVSGYGPDGDDDRLCGPVLRDVPAPDDGDEPMRS